MSASSMQSAPTHIAAISVTNCTSPAYDTRLSSSNTAESGANLWDTCTGSAFLVPGDCCVRNTNHPSSEGTFLISTPQTQPIRPWTEAKGAVGRQHRRVG